MEREKATDGPDPGRTDRLPKREAAFPYSSCTPACRSHS